MLVQEHSIKKKSEVLELLTNESNVLTGTVIGVGQGRRGKSGEYLPHELAVGDNVAYFRWNKEHASGRGVQRVLNSLGDGVTILETRDVLFTFSGGLKVDA